MGRKMRALLRQRRYQIVLAAVAVALLGAAAGFSYWALRPSPAKEPPRLVEASPTGEEVARMSPIVIRFAGDVNHKLFAKSFALSPSVQGSLAWEGQALVFQPQWPGYARGTTYTVTLAPPKKDGLPQPLSFSFTTQGKLAVQTVIPAANSTEVATDSAILVQFNRPVAPLTALEESPQGDVLRFDPPLAGQGKWLASAIYLFQPNHGLEPSTQYRVTVSRNVTDLVGGSLQEDYTWSFTTVSPALADVLPQDNAQFVGPDQEIRVTFNQPMDKASAQASFSLTVAATGAPVTGTFTWPDDNTLVFRPAAPLRRETRYQARVGRGATALGKPTATAQEFTWSFTTVGLPRVTATEPQNGETTARGYGVSITFSNPMDQESVEEAITISPQPEEGTVFYYWEPGFEGAFQRLPEATRLHINFPTQPSSPYTVTIGPGAKDRYGQPLQGAPFTLRYVTAPLPASLYINKTGNVGTFNAYGRPQVVVRSWNVAQLHFALWSIDQATLLSLADNWKRFHEFTPPKENLIRSWSQPLATPPPLNQVVVTTADLLTADDQPLPSGYYFLRVGAPGAAQDDRLLLVVSKTHLLMKRSQSQVLVWAVDMASGQPLPGLPITIYDRSGGQQAQGTTDADGIFVASIPKPQDAYDELLFATAQREGDAALVASRWTAGFEPWHYEMPFTFLSSPYQGHLYTDRPVYRPGQTVYYKGILRRDDDASYSLPPADLQGSITVTDSRGRLVTSQPLSLSDWGTFHGQVNLSSEAPTGNYSVNLFVGEASPDPKRYQPPLAWTSFLVAEYRKPEFQVELATQQPAYTSGETITVQVDSRYFFGAPVADAAVEWRVTSRDHLFHWPREPRYTFTDYDLLYGQDRRPPFRTRLEGEGRTDAQGRFSFRVPADVSTDPLSQVFVIEATISDASNQEVSATTEVVVHKGDFYIGLRPRSYVVTAGNPATVDVVTVDNQGEIAPQRPLTVSIYHRRWLNVKERDEEGELRWRSTPEDTLVEERRISSGDDGRASLSFTPNKGGAYRVVAEGRDAHGNPVRSAIYVWVSSTDYVSWRMDTDDRIELVADKEEYAPGDTARILVTAPFTDSLGLVTVERGNILSQRLVQFPTNSAVLEVPITEQHVPNIYVSVALFKGPTEENPSPSLRLGYVALAVSTAQKEIHITIEPNKERLGPRETVTYTITTTDAAGQPLPAELSLALVDMAVLSLAEETAARPLAAFWSQRPLAVSTAADFALSIDRLNESGRGRAPSEGKGGGGGGGIPTEDVRRLFPDTAYWNPTLRTDANGRATVSIELPDTLTTWRLTAKAVNPATQVGDATKDIITAKDLLIRPLTPRFLVINDTPRLEAIVHNYSDRPRKAQVSLTAEGLTLESAATQSVTIPPGEFRQVAWQTRVEPGQQAVLTFAAKTGGLADAVELTLPVYTYGSAEVVATAGQVTDAGTEVVELPNWAQPDRGELTLELSPSLAAGLRYAVYYVEEHPYDSVEQTVSRFLPRLALHRAINELGLPDTLNLGDELPGLVERSIQRLYKGQNFDGGWGWWPGDESSPRITAYALLGLAQARKEGFSVDDGVLQRAGDFLYDYLGQPSDILQPQNPDTRAFVLYTLAAAGQGDLGLTNALAERRQTLGATGKAFLVLALRELAADDSQHIPALLSDLTNAAIVSSTGSHWEEAAPDPRTMNTSTRATAIVLKALVGAQPDHPLVEGAVRWLMVARREGHWETTQETAWSLLALTDFMAARGELTADYSYQVRVNDKTLTEKKVDSSTLGQAETIQVAVSDLLLGAANRVGIARAPSDAKGRLYYTLRLRYFPPGEEVEAASHGVAVAREYLPAEGSEQALASVPLGSLVKVKLTVVAPTDLHYVVVEDFLPAGLEPIDTSLKTTSLQARQLILQAQQELAQANRQRWWFYPAPLFNHVEMRDDRVVLFATFLPKGVHHYVYLLKATTAGEFRVMPARAYEMYFPEVWGRSDGTTFTVEP